MKVGLIARADNVGLGIQTWEAYRNLAPDKTIIIDLTKESGTPQHFHRYPGVPHVTMGQWQQSTQWMDEFLEGLDVVFTCETAYRDDFYSYARYKGVKTVLQANFEFMPWFTNPALPKPDAFWMSSLYRYDDVPWEPKRYMPTPIARDHCKFLLRTVCGSFLHIIGRKTDMDRNGTVSVIDAQGHRRTEAKVFYSQARSVRHELIATPGLNVFESELDDYWKLYSTTSALVSPRRYAGQSLPMQEALSSGLPVISLDIDPQAWWLPPEWLIPATPVGTLGTQSGPLTAYGCDPRDLAVKMDEFASAPDFHEYSLHANEIAKTLDWDVWQQPYLDALREVAFSS